MSCPSWNTTDTPDKFLLSGGLCTAPIHGCERASKADGRAAGSELTSLSTKSLNPGLEVLPSGKHQRSCAMREYSSLKDLEFWNGVRP